MADAAVACRAVLFMRAVVTVLAVPCEGGHELRWHAVVAELEQQALARGGRHVAGRYERTQHDPRQQNG